MSLSQSGQSWLLAGEAGWWPGVLLPHVAGAVVDRVEVQGDLLRIWARPAADGAACPRCGRWCSRVHGRYTRTLPDAGIGGRRVLIRLLVRVLRCGSGDCETSTFAEQPAGLASPYARRTPLLSRQLSEVARALAGRAGARLAGVVAAEVSRCTLIRLLAAVPDPPPRQVRVLGVDDFSLRRGSTYATLLADMESGVPADVLPGRDAAALQDWLDEHPEVEVICRDRAGAYAQAARNAAPGAAQVADRWHIWHNLCGHARTAVARHRGSITAAPGPAGQQEQGRPQPGPAVPADLEAVITRRHQQVQQMRAAGQTLPEAAAALGLTEQVTGRLWRAATAGSLLAASATSALDPCKPWLRRRWNEGITSIATLHQEITAAGYRGSYMTTCRHASAFRLAAPPRPPAPPTARQVTSMILADPARLDQDEQARLTALRGRCPEIDALASHVATFAKILTRRRGEQLDNWIAAVEADPGQLELRSFASGIRHDYQAVRNALTLPWNSGKVEGLNTRTKLLKRQMYGRASLPLLRKRILLNS